MTDFLVLLSLLEINRREIVFKHPASHEIQHGFLPSGLCNTDLLKVKSRRYLPTLSLISSPCQEEFYNSSFLSYSSFCLLLKIN